MQALDSQPIVRDGLIHGNSPFDGTALEPISATPLDGVAGAITRARLAGRKLAELPVEKRAKLLVRFKNALLARAEAFRTTIVGECGKPEAEAWMNEILPTADLSSFWSEVGPEKFIDEEPELDPLSYPGKRARIERAPRGVIALITPWNFPMAIPLRTLFPAFLAGNGVVMKPSEFTPRTAVLIKDAADEAFGPGVLELVHGAGDVGAALIAGGVDAVVFTGSVATGRKVAHAAAEALIPAGLELGGKDAAIVLDDANLERAAQGIAWGGLVNAGQNCASVERVYATPGIAQKLAERVAEIVRELKAGTDTGALTTSAQLEIVKRHVADARAAGANVRAGGEVVEKAGRWFAPTVMTDVPASCSLMVDETFGPVIPIVRVENTQAAIEAANSTRYGLTASVWSKNLREAERVAKQLRAGVVTINNHSFTGGVPALPWTGVGDSGYGITNSTHALDVLTRPRAVLVDTSRAKRELWWYPYTPSLIAIGRAMTTLKSGASIGAKLGAVVALLKGFVSRWKR